MITKVTYIIEAMSPSKAKAEEEIYCLAEYLKDKKFIIIKVTATS